MYYSRVNEHFPRLFRWLKVLVFIPGIFMGIPFPYQKTRYFQRNDPFYFPIITIYNLIYCLFLTYLFLNTLHRERKEPYYPQKRVVALLTLLPIWYWFISALLVHSLNLHHLFKAWQGNFLILLVLLIYFLYRAFRDGIMGTRFRHEAFEWDRDGEMISQSARCIQHLCKNELSKIDWCAKNLETVSSSKESREYADIILRSSDHLKSCMGKLQHYSQELRLKKEFCSVPELISSCTDGFSRLYPNVSLNILCDEDLILQCDREAILEVFYNLTDNAAEAMNGSGTLSIKAAPSSNRRQLKISFQDTGRGIPPDRLSKLFTPYFSTKSSSDGHMGLGLYFCQKVMKLHSGQITVESSPDAGSIFSLCFPWKCVQTEKEKRDTGDLPWFRKRNRSNDRL